jgi:nicotinamidase-related amidase
VIRHGGPAVSPPNAARTRTRRSDPLIATAPLDPARTALLLIASPGPESLARLAGPLVRAAGLLSRVRTARAHVVHVRHLPPGADGDAGSATAVPSGGEAVLESAADDPFAGAVLGGELAARGVDTLVIAGPMSLGCCDAACRSALARRYRVIVADDALGASERGPAERARVVGARSRAGAEVLSATAVAGLLEPGEG